MTEPLTAADEPYAALKNHQVVVAAPAPAPAPDPAHCVAETVSSSSTAYCKRLTAAVLNHQAPSAHSAATTMSSCSTTY